MTYLGKWATRFFLLLHVNSVAQVSPCPRNLIFWCSYDSSMVMKSCFDFCLPIWVSLHDLTSHPSDLHKSNWVLSAFRLMQQFRT